MSEEKSILKVTAGILTSIVLTFVFGGVFVVILLFALFFLSAVVIGKMLFGKRVANVKININKAKKNKGVYSSDQNMNEDSSVSGLSGECYDAEYEVINDEK
ncbi:MAG: hypothetical protein U9O87_09735 [Verrucomicrobiota bacterium]|nr:hypothetical protein [Verrucomicrobiota bacterium]